jgi:DNA mismatch repair ATPase MutS
VFLAHIGSGVPAASMEFVPVGTVFSSVRILDNLSAGESFYLAEVRRIGALAAALADHGSAVAVIDEPFRGTNVHDAAEATLAVIARLAAHPAALVLVASHLGEVVPTIRADPGSHSSVSPLTFRAISRTLTIVFARAFPNSAWE